MEAILQTRRNERIRGLGKKRECTKRRIDHRMYQYLHVQCFYLSSTLHVYKSALTFLHSNVNRLIGMDSLIWLCSSVNYALRGHSSFLPRQLESSDLLMEIDYLLAVFPSSSSQVSEISSVTALINTYETRRKMEKQTVKIERYQGKN